ncbi:MAG: hypothetical protein HY874_03310 [Chloroflexi bacterium]|nr:hypothetical protein [Chloroflexota bacterium]
MAVTIAPAVAAFLVVVVVAYFLGAVLFPYEDNPSDTSGVAAKAIKLAGIVSLFAIGVAYFVAGVIFPYQGDPENNKVPLFTAAETRTISSVFAVICVAGTAWSLRRLWTHLRPK